MAQALGPQLVPLDLGIMQAMDIWMAYHPDVKRIARVKRTIDWIVQSFDPQQFPWFRDEFIHPNKLAEAYRGEPLVKCCSPVSRCALIRRGKSRGGFPGAAPRGEVGATPIFLQRHIRLARDFPTTRRK